MRPKDIEGFVFETVRVSKARGLNKFSKAQIKEATHWLMQTITDCSILALYEKGLVDPCFSEDGKFGFVSSELGKQTVASMNGKHG